jgi:peptide/nickel transport system permease protein
VVGSLCFWMMRWLPGDVATRLAASRYGYDLVGNEAASMVRSALGLDMPAWQAWGAWLWQVLRADLGESWVTGHAVWDEVGGHLLATMWLALVALVMAVVLGVPLGVLAAMQAGRLADRMTWVWAVTLKSTPTFLLAVVLMLVVAVQWGALPVASDGRFDGVWLPALVLALGVSAGLSRLVRDSLLTFRQSPAWQFARGKGLTESQVLVHHGMRHVAVTVVGYLGVQAALLLEGAVVVEALFAWPGIGHALVHAVFARDIPMIQGAALCMGLLMMVWSLLTDGVALWLNPRRRAARGGEGHAHHQA